MIEASAVGIVIQGQAVVRNPDGAARVILPDHKFHLGLFPINGFFDLGIDAFHVRAVAVGQPLRPDAAVAGPGAELSLAAGLVIPGPVGVFDVGHLVQIVVVVIPQGQVADQLFAGNGSGGGYQQKLAGAGFVIRLLVVIEPCRNRQLRFQMPVMEKIQPLRHLVDDDAHFLVHGNRFEHIAFDPPGHERVIVFDLAVKKAGGIGFDQGPVVHFLEHVHPLGGAGNHPQGLAVLVRLGIEHRMLPLIQVHHHDVGGQHFPDGLLVGYIHGGAPEASVLMGGGIGAAQGRGYFRFLRHEAEAAFLPEGAGAQKKSGE